MLIGLSGCCNEVAKEDNKGYANEERYMLGYTLDDGRILHFSIDIPYNGEDLGNAIFLNKLSLDSLTKKLKLVERLRDGGSKIYYYDRVSGEFGNNRFYMIVCNSVDGIRDVFFSENHNSLVDKCSIKMNDLSEVSMRIKDGTLTSTGATVIITDTSGRNNVYGSSFRVDKFENNEWKEVKKVHNDYAFTSMGYYVDKDGKLEFNCNWEYMYGKLSKGRYRIVKDTSEPGEIPRHYITAEFDID